MPDFSQPRHSSEKLHKAEFLGSFADVNSMPEGLAEVCVLGRSNSGKSTLISALIQNPAAVKISSKPGSTKTVNFFKVKNLFLVDLPGYGYARTGFTERDQLSQIIHNYITQRKTINAAFLLLDCKRELKEAENYIIDVMKKRHIPLTLVLTKIDRLNQKEMALLRKKIEKDFGRFFFQVFAVSARDKKNLPEILNFIQSLGG